jgi:hypothetical protein
MGYGVLCDDVSDKPAATIITVRCITLLSVTDIVPVRRRRSPERGVNSNRLHGVIIVLHYTPRIQQDIYFTSIAYKTSNNNTGISNILKLSHSSYLSAYEDGAKCSGTPAYKFLTLGNCPEESIQNTEYHLS